MNYILDAVIKKRKDTLNLDQKYILKLLNSEDPIDLNAKLCEIREKEFRLVSLDGKINLSNIDLIYNLFIFNYRKYN